ncbi:LSM1 protein, partial [Polyodon spathula]|nr:LSM1 protein [Polyodon spathula]
MVFYCSILAKYFLLKNTAWNKSLINLHVTQPSAPVLLNLFIFFLLEKHLVLLRDGRTLIGFLRSIDQFANLVLHQTVERIHVGKKYGDIPRGIFIVRGENVVLLGEIDLEKDSDTPLQQVSIEEILEEQRVEQQAKQEADKLKLQALKGRGLSIPRADTLDEY